MQESECNDCRNTGLERGKMAGDQGLVFGVGKGSGSPQDQGGAPGVNAHL